MSKYSRKVRTWGGLKDYTEHRNKAGNVTARTTFWGGKAHTSYTRHHKGSGSVGIDGMKNPSRSRSGSSGMAPLSPFASGAIAVLIALILIGAGIAWVVNAIAQSMTGVWPVIGTILCWASLAAWVGTVVHFVFAAIRRFYYDGPGDFRVWLTTIPQGILALMGGFVAFALVLNPKTSNGGFETFLDGFSTLSALAIYPVSLVALIVFSAVFTRKWLFVLLGGIPIAIILAATTGVFGFLFPAFVFYAVLMTRFSLEAD